MAVLTGKMAKAILKRSLKMPNFLVALLQKREQPDYSPIKRYVPKIKRRRLKEYAPKEYKSGRRKTL